MLNIRLPEASFGSLLCWAVFFLAFGPFGLTVFPLPAQAVPKPRVVASTSDLAALAREVGGDRIEVEFLVQGDQEAHSVQGKPSYLLKLRQTDLLVVVGLDLETGWLTGRHHTPSLISQSGNPRIQPGASGYFDASQYADILDLPTQPLTPNIMPFGNPYYWLDPENGRRIAQALANKLSEMRPEDASYFEDRFQAFSKRLSEAEKVWDSELQPYRGRKVVTYRRSWSNFLKHFQLVSGGEIEPYPGIPPSQGHTTELIKVMKNENVKIILVEPYFELKTPNAIARETGAKVLVMPSSVGGEERITDSFGLFDYDLTLLTKAFGSAENLNSDPPSSFSWGLGSPDDWPLSSLLGVSPRIELDLNLLLRR